MTTFVADGARWTASGTDLVGPEGPIDLGVRGDPGAQAAALLALVQGGLRRAEALGPAVVALASRPHDPAGRDTLDVDVVRVVAAWLAAEAGLAFRPVGAVADVPAIAGLAAVARGEPDTQGWAEVAGWLATPRPRWTHQEAVYEVWPDDRALLWLGLARARDVEAFFWYRSGVVLLDEALVLGGQLDAPCRAAWRALMEVRPGPRDFRSWHDALAAEVPALWTARRRVLPGPQAR